MEHDHYVGRLQFVGFERIYYVAWVDSERYSWLTV